MVIECKIASYRRKQVKRVLVFSAKIKDFIFLSMMFLQKLPHILVMISIEALYRSSRESHCYDVISNISQVEIKAVLLVSALFL